MLCCRIISRRTSWSLLLSGTPVRRAAARKGSGVVQVELCYIEHKHCNKANRLTVAQRITPPGSAYTHARID